jgi:hypothetical protein
MSKETEDRIPKITVNKDKLIIEIDLKELIFVINNSPEGYKVKKPKKLLQAFKKHLENYAASNATEKGISEFQDLLDQITDEIVINEDDIIIENED